MTISIQESDWKYLRKREVDMLSTLCGRVNEQSKEKLTPTQKAAKKKRQKEYRTIFINGKQKRVKRPPTIDGMDVHEYIRRNADPIWLHQNEMWEYFDQGGD